MQRPARGQEAMASLVMRVIWKESRRMPGELKEGVGQTQVRTF